MKNLTRAVLGLVALVVLAGPGHAKCYSPVEGGSDGACGAVQQYLDGSGKAQSVDSAHPLPTNTSITIAPSGNISTVTALTITATSYTNGMCLDGLKAVSSAAPSNGSGYVQSVLMSDASGQNAATDIVVFDANPTNSTFTDHAACTINSADLSKRIATIHVTDQSLYTTTGGGQALQQAAAFALGSSNTTLWFQAITRGTPTYTGTGNLSVKLIVVP